jgi:hypothetical protein
LESEHQIAAVKICVAIPVACGPAGVAFDLVFVDSGLEDLDKIGRVEFPVKIGVAEIGVA